MEAWETWFLAGRVSNGSRYNGIPIFVSPSDLKVWLGPDPEVVRVRTGAQGRPTKSMPLIMEEFARRVREGSTARSREAQAKELAAWLRDTYPNAERPSPKTIQNNLPTDFRPRGNGRPK